MSNVKRRKTQGNKSFVMLGRGMLLGNLEWKGLSIAAKVLYVYLKAKYNGSNNGGIHLHYSELKGVKGLSSPSTVSRAFRELENKAWIKRTKQGGLYRYFNEYELIGGHGDYLS